MRRINKIFLVLGMIIFSLTRVVGCSSIETCNTINATYIATYFDGDISNSQFNMVYNHHDLETLLGNNTPDKYNDYFFKTKSLLVFKIIESSGKNKSEIKSYTISDSVLNVYIEAKSYADTYAEGHWWFILELDNNEISNIDGVRIFKNGEVIMDNINNNTLVQHQDYYLSYSFENVKKWPDFIGEEYNLSFGERRYYFILSFLELKTIFEKSTEKVVDDYFNANIFDDNIVLCVVRDEAGGTANIKYSNFKINGLELSIEENFIDGGAEVVSKYLDFVVIPKDLFPKDNFNQGIEYYWK